MKRASKRVKINAKHQQKALELEYARKYFN